MLFAMSMKNLSHLTDSRRLMTWDAIFGIYHSVWTVVTQDEGSGYVDNLLSAMSLTWVAPDRVTPPTVSSPLGTPEYVLLRVILSFLHTVPYAEADCRVNFPILICPWNENKNGNQIIVTKTSRTAYQNKTMKRHDERDSLDDLSHKNTKTLYRCQHMI